MNPVMACRLSHALSVAAICVLATAPVALGARSTTHLLSQTPQGTFPNGPSFDAAISRDRQVARLAAYDSLASDLVPGDVNGVRDVFVVHRAQPYETNPTVGNGSEWVPGQTDLVSTGLGGQPANGPSWGPDLDGDQAHIPHCVAFLSAASNLVPNDTNGKVDAFVKDLNTGVITDVSVNTAGQQANGDTYDVKIDGACDRVAFTSDATNLALTAAPRPAAKRKPAKNACAKAAKRGKKHRRRKKGKRVCAAAPTGTTRAVAVTTAPPAGTKQVYVRILDNSQADNAGLAATTFLASASTSGEAGNGNSYGVSFGKLSAGCPRHCGSMSGDAVAFTSDATNLAPGDNNGQPDVYERTFVLPVISYKQRRAGKIPAIQMRTMLVSAGSDGQAGNGASDQPSIDDAGDVVAFRTAATNLLPGDTNGVTDVALAHTDSSPPRLDWVSRSGGAIGNGASSHPSVARAGSPLVFQTDASNLTTTTGADYNCVSDVLFWNIVNRLSIIVSNDSEGQPSGSPPMGVRTCPAVRTTPAENPVGSYYTNYIAFEDSNPLLDIPVGDRVFPGLSGDPSRAARLAASDDSLHQVYMHFIYTP